MGWGERAGHPSQRGPGTPAWMLGEDADGSQTGEPRKAWGRALPGNPPYPLPTLPPAHSAARAPGSLDLPLPPGHAPRPRLAQCPSWANFLTPSGQPLSLGHSCLGEVQVGGSGLRLLGKFPGVFETGVAGRRGPFGSCQGVLPSQNRTVLQQTLLLARFPPSAPDFLIRPGAIGWSEEGDRERCCRVLGKGDPVGIPARDGKDFPLPHRSTSFDFWPLLPGSGRPGKARTNLRDPGAHLIPAHLRTAPAGRGRGELGSAPRGSGLGYCIVPVWARSRVFYLPRYPPPPAPNVFFQDPDLLLSRGHAQGRTSPLTPLRLPPAPHPGLHPPPPTPTAPPRAQVSQRRSIFLD